MNYKVLTFLIVLSHSIYGMNNNHNTQRPQFTKKQRIKILQATIYASTLNTQQGMSNHKPKKRIQSPKVIIQKRR